MARTDGIYLLYRRSRYAVYPLLQLPPGNYPAVLNWRLLRRHKPTVAEQLRAETYRFDFYKAVQILEKLREETQADWAFSASGSDISKKPVWFRANSRQAFPASNLDSLQPPEAENTPVPVLTANFMGLVGGLGVLPAPYAELVLERKQKGDTALQSFLDIFHHRLISLLYRVRQTHRVGYDARAPWRGRFAHFLYSFIGLGTEGLQHLTRIDDHVFLYYAGLLVHQPRSIVALESMLRTHFQVPVEGLSFKGGWYRLPEDEYTRLGLGGSNQVLGQSAALGSRVWDQQGRFEIKLGPLKWKEFINFLPIGWGFLPLYELTRFFVGQELDFDIRLSLRSSEVPGCQLMAATEHQRGARLGWSAWLQSPDKAALDDKDIILSPRLLHHFSRGVHIPLLAHLPQAELEEFLSKAQVHYFPIHTMVIREGEEGNSLYIINTGSVQVVKPGLESSQQLLATLREGDFFGEYSLLSGNPRTASVITTSDAKILEISKEDIQQVQEKHPRVGQILRYFYVKRQKSERV